jgi:hypothetical protein
MSDFIPKPGAVKIGGLGRKAQKLQALRDKAAQGKNAEKPHAADTAGSLKAKTLTGPTKKTSFQRKAV